MKLYPIFMCFHQDKELFLWNEYSIVVYLYIFQKERRLTASGINQDKTNII